MDLEKCRVLLSVIETGSLSATAKKTGMTISGVSKMMTSLEKAIGLELLYRSRNGILPTDHCKELLPYIQSFVYNGNVCFQKAAQINGLDTGRVSIGVAHRAFYEPLARITKSFKEKFPNIDVQIRNGYSSALLEKLNNHTLDFCVISKRDGNHKWIPIYIDEMVAWVPNNDKFSSYEKIPVSIFENESYIATHPGEDTDNARLFKANHVTPNTQLSTHDAYATYSMVGAGLGISAENRLTSLNWLGNVKLLSLEPEQKVEIGVAMMRELTPASSKFLNFVKNELEENKVQLP